MIINYQKHFGNNGTCYTQHIKIDNWLKEYYNNYLMNLKQQADKNYIKNRVYSESDLNIKSIQYLEKGINYTNLLNLDIFFQVIYELNEKGYNFNFKRILWRNTTIEVVD